VVKMVKRGMDGRIKGEKSGLKGLGSGNFQRKRVKPGYLMKNKNYSPGARREVGTESTGKLVPGEANILPFLRVAGFTRSCLLFDVKVT